MPPTPAQPRTQQSPAAPARCPRCDYDLQGLPPLSRAHPCPECGHPDTDFAPPRTWLRHAEPRWLRNVHLGVTLQVWSGYALSTTFVSAIAVLILAVVFGSAADLADSQRLRNINDGLTPLFLVPFIAAAVGIIAHTAACWLMTSPPAPHHFSPARRLVRLCGVAFAPLCALSALPLTDLIPSAPPATQIARALVAIAIATMYLYALDAWCERLRYHSERWSCAAPARRRSSSRAILAAAAAAIVVDVFVTFLLLPERDAARGRPDSWPLWFLLAYAVVLRNAVTPALHAVRHERRAAKAPRDNEPPPDPSAPTKTPASDGGREQ